MTQIVGVYKVAPLSLALNKDGKLGQNNSDVTLKMRIGNQEGVSNGKGFDIQWNQVHLFEQTFEQKLIVSIYSNQQKGQIGYAEILLTPLVKYPETKHQITVHTVYRLENMAVIDKESAILEIEVFYTEKLNSSIEITILDAELVRNTENIGKMDPYVRLQLNQSTFFHTSVKEQAGKFPKWNETFTFSIGNPNSAIKLEVRDEDLAGTFDVVGTCLLKLREDGYLKLQPIEKTLDILYKEDKAGKLRIKTRFNLQK